MADGRSNRKSKIVPFVDQLSKDRKANLEQLILKAKSLKIEGFQSIIWSESTWSITGGRLIKNTGRNSSASSFRFHFAPKLGGLELMENWADIAKVLFILRYHRKYQDAKNHRNFICAIGYIAQAAIDRCLTLDQLNPEIFDAACLQISKDYKPSSAYNLHKAVGEFAGHCDANLLCRIAFNYKYVNMVRPENAGGVGYKRLDDPHTLKTESHKLIDPLVFKILGELYQFVPKSHKYRFYILFLTLLLCTGKRFSEISLLPYQDVQVDLEGHFYINYFPRKTSQGDSYTPLKKHYLISNVVEIVKDTIEELKDFCRSARETAEEMYLTKGADVRFLSQIDDNKRLYKKDLIALGITPGVLDITGWIRKNNLLFPVFKKLTNQNRKGNDSIICTTKAGVIAYCQKDFDCKYNQMVQIDQFGKKYYLKDLLLVRHMGLSSGGSSRWIATKCTHSMMTTFLRYFHELSEEFAPSSAEVDFVCHGFRHTLNTLLDEGGLSDLLQTEWFGRSNPRDTKAYQHTSREKRALMLREDIKNGRAGGKITDIIQNTPVTHQDAILKIRIQAVHDVGTGICIHNFSQLPCERHLQCSADCDDYVWAKDDKGREEELKRQFAMTSLARSTAEERTMNKKPKKSSDWLIHNEKKLKTLSLQLKDNGIADFDYQDFLKGLGDD